VTPVVDGHLHYWEPDTPERPHSPLGVDLGPAVSVEEALATLDAAGVSQAIQVTPSCMGFDNRYALEGAERFPDRIRVFGRLDPTAPDVVERLDEWHAHPLAVGVRLTLLRGAGEWAGVPAWKPFWRHCEALGMPVAIYAPGQARALGALAAAHPALTVLVDHCALGHDPETLARWHDVLDLARLQNVCLKVSYFPEATREAFPFVRAQRLMRDVHERFGADRLIWGSNFPPVLKACTYEQALRFVSEACDFLTAGDRDELLGGTIRRVVGL
jgi:predicted TIM-barrel fold metal-dependent hydrolase